VADVIPLYRVKTIAARDLADRFRLVEKTPPKALEFRRGHRTPRFAGHELEAIAGVSTVKFTHRLRRSAKLRLFRVFKLMLRDLKDGPAVDTYRPVAERLREARWMRRL
jgi:hypothetical protein